MDTTPDLGSPHVDDVPASAARLPVTVDVVALTVRGGRLQVLLVTRLLAPFRGALALPGGFVLPDETLDDAARRELAEETGVVPPGHLEQLRTYGPLGRDPRGPVVTIAHLLLAPASGLPAAPHDAVPADAVPADSVPADSVPADSVPVNSVPDRPTPGGDASDAAWYDVAGLRGLAFDHAQIVRDGVERARAKLEYSALATAFCPPEFTVAELRAVYETVWGVTLDPRNFHRKVTGTPGFLVETGRSTSGGAGRPAALYRLAPDADPAAVVLNPPVMRPSPTT